jgi:hypothetical protein
MGDAGPTRGHSGIGVRSHIEEKSPKPMATVAAVEMWSQGGGCRPMDVRVAGAGDGCRRWWRRALPLTSVRVRGYVTNVCWEC